jgi:hypothetical protein
MVHDICFTGFRAVSNIAFVIIGKILSGNKSHQETIGHFAKFCW